MTFADPLVLIALIAIPALLAGYVVNETRRHRAAAGLATSALAASLTPRPPGWRRHLPPLIVALALAALILAAARPRHAVIVPIRGAAFVLANDVSDSMLATDVRPTRLAAARAAATRFVAALPSSALVGQMSFARRPTVLRSPTTDHPLDEAAIRQLAPGGGGTAIGETITTAVSLLSRLRTPSHTRPPAVIVLLSDGGANVGPSPVLAARRARVAHIPVDVVALGTDRGTITVHRHGRAVKSPVPVEPAVLEAIATASGGRAYSATDAGDAKRIYTRLAATLGHRHVLHSLVTSFAGGGLALIIAGGGLSLAWFGRLL